MVGLAADIKAIFIILSTNYIADSSMTRETFVLEMVGLQFVIKASSDEVLTIFMILLHGPTYLNSQKCIINVVQYFTITQ